MSSGAKIVNIPLNSETDELNIIILEELLQKYSSIIKKFEESSKKKLKKIGAFSAGSNVTGIENNVNIITALLHKYEFLAVWDYACAAPYVSIDMNPRFVENGNFVSFIVLTKILKMQKITGESLFFQKKNRIFGRRGAYF